MIATLALGIYALYFYALDQADPDHADAAGHRGPDPHARRGGGREHRRSSSASRRRCARARRVGQSIVTGYRKGLTAIIDANVVTFLVAFILFILATAGVKGFAFTLGLGVLVSLLTAVRRDAGDPVLDARHAADPQPRGARRGRAAVQVPLQLHGRVALVLLDVRRDPADRRAGDRGQGRQLRHRLRGRHAHHRAAGARPRRSTRCAARSRQEGLADAKIQTIDNPDLGKNVVQITTDELGPAEVGKVEQDLRNTFGLADDPTTESIGPSFGQSVASSAIIAIIASLTVISIYIALRFEWKVAVPVLIALMHDVLIVAGVYALVGREVTTSTVAALLTILGYSLYDTIIVFDRVRENIPRMPSAAFSQIVNRSLSEVLTRSLATSFCTLLPVLSLMLFGGETLQDFAFALLVGIASGTYSSVFIATPVLAHWKEREPVYATRERRIRETLGAVPAYATAAQGGPVDVAPSEPRGGRARHHRRRRTRRRASRGPSSTTWCATSASRRREAREPAAAARAASRPPGRRPPRPRARRRRPTPAAGPRRAPAATTPAGDEPKPRKPRNRKHGRPR